MTNFNPKDEKKGDIKGKKTKNRNIINPIFKKNQK